MPDEWGDGGDLHLAAHDANGWPSSVLTMQMVGLPVGDWQPGDEHVWSYWLVMDEASDEDEAIRIMSSVSGVVDSRVTVRVVE